MHGLDDHGRGVEGGEGGPFCAGVVLGREEAAARPRALPAGVFVRPVTGSGKMPRATGPKPGKRARTALLVAGRWACSMAWSVRIAARSAGLGFAPLVVGTPGPCGRRCLRHGAVAGGCLVEVDVVDNRRVWYGQEGHGASPKQMHSDQELAGVAAPAGSLWVIGPCARTKGGEDGRNRPSGQHPEVTPAVLGVIGQDRRDRCSSCAHTMAVSSRSGCVYHSPSSSMDLEGVAFCLP